MRSRASRLGCQRGDVFRVVAEHPSDDRCRGEAIPGGGPGRVRVEGRAGLVPVRRHRAGHLAQEPAVRGRRAHPRGRIGGAARQARAAVG
ncbi:hypothetical protein ABZ234_08340 [Nocardiopsis sp. NPDC006198]|uniref:hypothetical protein n=1 Tax=Nocardiopsis sp. NPDC006198 TaxID=3154472 RepID=UPI0033B88A66